MTNGSNVTQNTTHWKLIWLEKISSGSRSFSLRTRQRVYILRKLPIVWYHTVKKYHTDNIFIVQSAVYQQFLFLRMILAGHVPHCVCRCQYNEIYFCELFRAAHFSQKIKQPSEKVPTVHFLLCNTISQPSKIALYSIYVIMYVHGNQLTWTSDIGRRTTDDTL